MSHAGEEVAERWRRDQEAYDRRRAERYCAATLTHGRRRARRLEKAVLVVFCFAVVVAFLALALGLALLILVVIA